MRRSRTAVAAASAVAATATTAIAVLPGTAGSLYARGADVARPMTARVVLYAAPASRHIRAELGTRTDFGSPTTFAVVTEGDKWLGVIAPSLGNDELGYLRRSQVRLAHDGYVLEVDRSGRRLTVWRMGKRLRQFRVAIGRSSSPTPIGRFAITDKLSSYQPALYGCCLLALSGHQTHLPSGWTGGDRLAIHGGGGIGEAVSAGCLHAREADLRYLMQHVPLGTQVVIHT
jgi:lipoprotein-anchoring transpeptidase ErfK/SrfK